MTRRCSVTLGEWHGGAAWTRSFATSGRRRFLARNFGGDNPLASPTMMRRRWRPRRRRSRQRQLDELGTGRFKHVETRRAVRWATSASAPSKKKARSRRGRAVNGHCPRTTRTGSRAEALVARIVAGDAGEQHGGVGCGAGNHAQIIEVEARPARRRHGSRGRRSAGNRPRRSSWPAA